MLKILGYDYEAQLLPHHESAASCHTTRQLIRIDAGMPAQAQQSALLHEIIEALNYHLALDLEHNAIMALEAGLFQTLTANGVTLAPLLQRVDAG